MNETIISEVASRLEMIRREQAAKRAVVRRKQECGPWKDPCSGNGWFDDCPECGTEILFGWDDGFAFPDDVRLETDCAGCCATIEYPIAWIETHFESPRIVRSGNVSERANAAYHGE